LDFSGHANFEDYEGLVVVEEPEEGEEPPEDDNDYSKLGSGTAEAFLYVSKFLNEQSSKKVKFAVKHKANAGCYLKVWMRLKVQDYKLKVEPTAPPVPCEGGSATGCESSPPHSDDCALQVLSQDAYCCDTEWDWVCEDSYQQLLAATVSLPPKWGVSCNEHVPDGDPYYIDLAPYVWEPSGGRCVDNTLGYPDYLDDFIYSRLKEIKVEVPGLYPDPELQEELDPDGYDPLGVDDAEGTNRIQYKGKSMELEYKYSYVKGYEPSWPTEAEETSGCHPNGFPQPSCF
jgi:hypothetical protein